MEGHTGVFNINYIPTKKLSFNIASAYTDSKAHIEDFNFSGPLEYAPGTDGARERYYNYDFSNVADYSDLHIRELDLTLSASYK